MGFHLLTGQLPFQGDGTAGYMAHSAIWEQIKKLQFTWPKTPVDSAASGFVNEILVIDLSKRLGGGSCDTCCSAGTGNVDYKAVQAHRFFSEYNGTDGEKQSDWSQLPVPVGHTNGPMKDERESVILER